jgi:hypothetical protein
MTVCSLCNRPTDYHYKIETDGRIVCPSCEFGWPPMNPAECGCCYEPATVSPSCKSESRAIVGAQQS